MEYEEKTIQQIYQHLCKDRDCYLTRGREASEVTIAHLLPQEGTNSEPLVTSFQSLGARGVNNLASKLLMTLLPTNTPFFRLRPDEFEMGKLETQKPGMRAIIEAGLGEVETMVMTEIEVSSVRIAVSNALKQLLVAGNVLVYIPKKGDVRVFRLDRYVVERDPMGNVLQIVTKEDLTKETLPESIKDEVMGKLDAEYEDEVCLYTHIKLDEGKWKVRQEVAGINIPESEGTFPRNKSPYLALRLTKVDGESYGPGYVEESLGDLLSLERLSQALLEGSAAAARIIYMVNPNSVASIKELSEVANGGFVSGMAEDVRPLQLDKYNDFRVVADFIRELRGSLSLTFLLNSSVQRNAERVTAEEVRFMAQELEDALGGVYSVLTQEFQLPLVNAIMDRLQSQGRMPALPKDVIRPSIVTGLDALGRGHDQSKLERWVASVLQVFGPEGIGRINISDFLLRSATNLGLDINGLVKTEEQIKAEREQMMQQQMLQQSLPNIVNQGGQLMKEQVKQQGEI